LMVFASGYGFAFFSFRFFVKILVFFVSGFFFSSILLVSESLFLLHGHHFFCSSFFTSRWDLLITCAVSVLISRNFFVSFVESGFDSSFMITSLLSPGINILTVSLFPF